MEDHAPSSSSSDESSELMIDDSSSSDESSELLVDDLYLTLVEKAFPISDEKFAEELHLQEAIASSLWPLTTTTTIASANSKSSKAECSLSCSESLCTICMDAKSGDEMFRIRGCSHSFCFDCISKHIAAKLEDSIAVKCPEPKCTAALDPEMCRAFVPKEVLERWGDALFEAMIMKTKRVYCPYKDCSAAMIDEGEEAVTAAECMNCRRLFCVKCRDGWHSELDCGEFQKLREAEGGGNREDVMTMMLADRKKWKRCPNCRVYVEKTAGCVHISCRCGTEFCYNCGSNWRNGHTCVILR